MPKDTLQLICAYDNDVENNGTRNVNRDVQP